MKIKAMTPASGRVLFRERERQSRYWIEPLIGWAVVPYNEGELIEPVVLDNHACALTVSAYIRSKARPLAFTVLLPGEPVPEEWKREDDMARHREEIRAEAKAAEREQRQALREEGLL